MSEGPERSAKPRGGIFALALWGAALVGAAAVVYIIAQASTKPAPPVIATQEAAEPAPRPWSEKYVAAVGPAPPPDYPVNNQAGRPVRIADFKGKVVVMNIWATWCGPCKIEMPTLARLQAAYAGQPLEVVAVSIDGKDKAAEARLFIAQNEPLAFYHDPASALPFELAPPAPGMPTTVIYGKDGLEIGRLAGEADWMGPEARALIDAALAKS